MLTLDPLIHATGDEIGVIFIAWHGIVLALRIYCLARATGARFRRYGTRINRHALERRRVKACR